MVLGGPTSLYWQFAWWGRWCPEYSYIFNFCFYFKFHVAKNINYPVVSIEGKGWSKISEKDLDSMAGTPCGFCTHCHTKRRFICNSRTRMQSNCTTKSARRTKWSWSQAKHYTQPATRWRESSNANTYLWCRSTFFRSKSDNFNTRAQSACDGPASTTPSQCYVWFRYESFYCRNSFSWSPDAQARNTIHMQIHHSFTRIATRLQMLHRCFDRSGSSFLDS